uniref:ATPbinding Cassette (ABC) Superfamily putative n=1 Tax=Albugo laibachii Nc14 TaxID=890382 RepID=F0WYP7_9STRA|nr:ATPbinding Cassette (ABC) Superfamily putative [Albugo laibachii Nc14]|eukprot:CCA26606.1 ATPbinding Cassette (ABC) Superfamily putative [Albugo laibachii Nc14]
MPDYYSVDCSEIATSIVPKRNANSRFALTWKHITYTVSDSKKQRGKKCILRNVSGYITPGRLTAILGPSGSGKTTLLNVLADRVHRNADVQGTIELNGLDRVNTDFTAITSYVAQEDALLGSFSVMETLMMAAKLTLSPEMCKKNTIRQQVDFVLGEMGLQSCRDTIVGDIYRKGLSGGQKRRLCVAIELLSNPSILLMDEPTSGLDSNSAYHTIRYIQKLCQRDNKSVLCTIHQPSSRVFSMFDNVLFLTEGAVTYFGSGKQAREYFTHLGHECPLYSNPAEHILTLINLDYEDENLVNIQELAHQYANSEEYQHTLNCIEDAHSQVWGDPLRTQQMNVSAWSQFMVLFHRNLLNNLRNPGILWIRLVMNVCLSAMGGSMFLYTNHRITEYDIVTLLFYIQAFLVFMSVAVLPAFIQERSVFIRERTNSSLSVISYTFANLVASVPGIALIALISSSIVVSLAGIHGFGMFVLNLFLSLMVAESLMHVIGALVPHFMIGITLGAGIFGMFMLCEGFMVPRDVIPGYWIWAHYLAFHSYSFETFVYMHFRHVDSITAKEILDRFGFDDANVTQNMGILVLYVVILEAMYTLILARFHNGRHQSF